jgi:hypothetical protein
MLSRGTSKVSPRGWISKRSGVESSIDSPSTPAAAVPERDRTSKEVAVNCFQKRLFARSPIAAAVKSRAASLPVCVVTANTPSVPVSSRSRSPRSADIVIAYGLFDTSNMIAPSTTSPSGVVNCRSNGCDRRPRTSGNIDVAVSSFASR